MRYAWIIDRDHLNGPGGEFDRPEDDEAGVMGPRDAPDALLDRLKTVKRVGIAFRMRDDDNVLYYSGRILFEDKTITAATLPDEAFGPLDDYGTPNAGCVAIYYRVGGKWTML